MRELLQRWSVAHLKVHCRCQGEIAVPFCGSLLRGALGAALYRQVCVAKGIPCSTCEHRSHCNYPALFEPPGGEGPGIVRGDGSSRPFALIPPARIEEGPLSFEIKLFGPPAGLLLPFLRALVEMGEEGMGRERVPFPVSRVESLGPGQSTGIPVYDEGDFFPDRVLLFPASRVFDGFPVGRVPSTVVPTAPVPSTPGLRRVILSLKTPLRMKQDGKIQSGLEPRWILRAALRRLTDLGTVLGQDWPRRWPGVLSAAASMRLSGGSTRWLDWGRYSRRQGRAMRLGGVVGTVEYAGVPEELVSLLRVACFVHLGKNTTFGLGQIDLEELR